VKGSTIWVSPKNVERGFSAPKDMFDSKAAARSAVFFFTLDWDSFEDGDREVVTAYLLDPNFFLTFA
jgi:hypothetical protein